MIELHKTDQWVHVRTPYVETFPPAARAIGGVWNAQQKTWSFPAGEIKSVERILLGCYGTIDGNDTIVDIPAAIIFHAGQALAGLDASARGTVEIAGVPVITRNKDGCAVLAKQARLLRGTVGSRQNGGAITCPEDTEILVSCMLWPALLYLNGGLFRKCCKLATRESHPVRHAELLKLPTVPGMLGEQILCLPENERKELFRALAQILKGDK